MNEIFFKNRYYTEREFLDEMNGLEDFLYCTRHERWGKMADGRWSPEDEPEPEELNPMLALARELADIDLLDKSWEIRVDILDNLAEIFEMYGLQGKGLVNLDKLRAVADQLEEAMQEYLEVIL